MCIRDRIGTVMSVILATFSGGILRIVSIAPALLEPAEIYLRIVGDVYKRQGRGCYFLLCRSI